MHLWYNQLICEEGFFMESKRRQRSRLRIYAVLIAALFILSGRIIGSHFSKYQDNSENQSRQKYIKVVEVLDGDTVSIRRAGRVEKVRLIGIDAPELGQSPWGEKSKKHLRETISLSGWLVRLEFDIDKVDRYGRLLAYLWTPGDNSAKSKNINIQMVEDGYAVLYTVPPNVKYAEQIGNAQKRARHNKRGIWGKSGLRETPSDYRKKTSNGYKRKSEKRLLF